MSPVLLLLVAVLLLSLGVLLGVLWWKLEQPRPTSLERLPPPKGASLAELFRPRYTLRREDGSMVTFGGTPPHSYAARRVRAVPQERVTPDWGSVSLDAWAFQGKVLREQMRQLGTHAQPTTEADRHAG